MDKDMSLKNDVKLCYNVSMIDPKKVDMNRLPKKFVDGAIGAHGRDVFSFALTSGNNLDSFATTPQIMKSIAIWINGQVQNYEKTFGEINMTPPQITSPIQMADLKKSRDDNSDNNKSQ